MANATKMEDTIAIEKQLEEITQTIELLQGKIRFMQKRVAFSTIRTDLNSTRRQNGNHQHYALPVGARELGNGVPSPATRNRNLKH